MVKLHLYTANGRSEFVTSYVAAMRAIIEMVGYGVALHVTTGETLVGFFVEDTLVATMEAA